MFDKLLVNERLLLKWCIRLESCGHSGVFIHKILWDAHAWWPEREAIFPERENSSKISGVLEF